MPPVVTVVIPAYKAEDTVARTIASVQAQTCREIEIIVVDDGSPDGTSDVVRSLMASDPRIDLIRQDNAGVSSARNTGIERATGQFIAPLDSDDIWHPEKLDRQIARLTAASARVGLVYSWYRRIDGDDRVLPVSPSPQVEGPVLHRHLEWNFISNGSTLLVPAEIAKSVMYDVQMRDATGQGCEDYLFQLRIAKTHEFACEPGYLAGYRRVGGSISSAVEDMIRWHLRMYDILLAEAEGQPGVRDVIMRRQGELLVELSRNQLRQGQMMQAGRHMLRAMRTAPARVPSALSAELWTVLSRAKTKKAAQPVLRDFFDYDPKEQDGLWKTRRSAQYLAELERMDRDMSIQPTG